MIIGIAGGLFFGGMLLGAITGSLGLMLGCCAAGLIVAGAAEAAQKRRERDEARLRLGAYPPYGY